MKLRIIISFIIVAVYINGCNKSANDILKKTSNKLERITTVEYQTKFKNFNSFTGELGMSDSAKAFFNLNSADTIIGAKYHFFTSKSDYGFNGSTSFYTIKDKKQLIYEPAKSYVELIGFQFLYFSIHNLRSLLPQLLKDTSIFISRSKDTIINNTECYQFNIDMHNKGISMNGKLVQKDNIRRKYTLMIDKKKYLPKQFIVLYEESSPLWIITYNDIDFSTTKNDSIFNYLQRNTNYAKYNSTEYSTVRRNENSVKNNLSTGTKAIDWILPSMKGDSVHLSKSNANLILLEFWFPYCTGCVKAIPDINEIQEKYKNKGLQVYGIEYTKPDSIGLTNYIGKMKIEYTTLFSAKEVALNYRVSAGPSIFLINKEGKIVYARTGFIKDEVINEIEKNIK